MKTQMLALTTLIGAALAVPYTLMADSIPPPETPTGTRLFSEFGKHGSDGIVFLFNFDFEEFVTQGVVRGSTQPEGELTCRDFAFRLMRAHCKSLGMKPIWRLYAEKYPHDSVLESNCELFKGCDYFAAHCSGPGKFVCGPK